MRLKSPIKKIKGKQLTITLPYCDKTYLQSYILLGWDLKCHNGIDIVCSPEPIETYGVPIIAAQDGLVTRIWFDTEMSRKGNGVEIQHPPFYGADGKRRIIKTKYWHLAKVNVKAGDIVKQGDKIGTCGNSGMLGAAYSDKALMLWPLSDADLKNPYRATHLHFGVYLFVEERGIWKLEFPENGTKGAVNPLEFLEPKWKENAPEIEKVAPEEKFYPLVWALNIVIQKVREISEKVSQLTKSNRAKK